MGKRFFPAVTGKFFLVTGDPTVHYIVENGAWVRVKSWKDHPGYPHIDEPAALIEAGGSGYDHVNIVWVMDGRHWCLDLDTKNIPKMLQKRLEVGEIGPEDVAPYNEILTNQHRQTAEAASDYTFTEVSRSGNGFHVIFDPLEENVKDFGTVDGYGCAELYKGNSPRFIILTGRALSSEDVNSLPTPFIDVLKKQFPSSAEVPITLDPPNREKPSAPLTSGNPWFHTGQGEQPRDRNNAVITRSAILRFTFACQLAKEAYGMPDAAERIWEAMSNSWFATTWTPANSQTPKRFTSNAGAFGVKKHDIRKALHWAHQDDCKLAAAREENAAMVGPLVAASKQKLESVLAAQNPIVKAPPPEDKVIPEIPPLPDSYLFNLIYDLAEKNLSKPHEGWQKIMTLHTAAMLVGAVFHGSCVSFVVPGGSGSGKANPVKFLNGVVAGSSLPGAMNVFFDPRSDFSSGEAIRDTVSDTTVLLPLLDEAGPLLSGIGSGDPKYASWQTHLPRAVDGTKINRGARAKGTEANVEVAYPRFVAYFALQPQYLAAYLSQYSIDNGICGRLTMFPPQHRQREVAPAFVRDRLEGMEPLQNIVRATAGIGKAAAYHWTQIADGEALAKRLHEQFPHYHVLEPIHSRLGQMVKRWATLSWGSRHCTKDGFGQGQGVWLNLEEQDIEFGFAIAQMHWDTLRYYIGQGEASVGGETIKQRLILEGILVAMRAQTKINLSTIGMGKLKQTIKGYNPNRNVHGIGRVGMTEQEVKSVLDELVGMGILETGVGGRNGRGTVWTFKESSYPLIEQRARDCANI